MPVKDNRREKAKFDKSDANLSKPWPTQLAASIKEIPAHQKNLNVDIKIQCILSHYMTHCLEAAPEIYDHNPKAQVYPKGTDSQKVSGNNTFLQLNSKLFLERRGKPYKLPRLTQLTHLYVSMCVCTCTIMFAIKKFRIIFTLHIQWYLKHRII